MSNVLYTGINIYSAKCYYVRYWTVYIGVRSCIITKVESALQFYKSEKKVRHSRCLKVLQYV